MVLSTGVTGGGGGGASLVGGTGGMYGCRVGMGGFLVGMEGFRVETAGLRGGGVTLFGGRGALVVVAAVDLGITGTIFFGVTGGRMVVVVLFWSKSGM